MSDTLLQGHDAAIAEGINRLVDGSDDKAVEIEITPETIEAGLEAFCAYDHRFDSEEDAVRKIFCTMLAAQGNRT